MSAECKICGYSGPTVMRNGRCCCGACGTEVPSQPQVNTNSSFSSSNSFSSGSSFSSGATTPPPKNESVSMNIPCPVCKNAAGNTFSNGKVHCSLCGNHFDIPKQAVFDPSASYTTPSNSNAKRIAELEEEKESKTTWGIIFLFLFWPIGIYNLYKASKISQEIKRLRG